MQTQRTVLWIIFSMSLLFLWDAWQKHQGKPSLFSATSTQTQTTGGSTPADAGKGAEVPGTNAATAGSGQAGAGQGTSADRSVP